METQNTSGEVFEGEIIEPGVTEADVLAVEQNPLTDIRQMVAMSLRDDATLDTVSMCIGAVSALQRFTREVVALKNDRMLEYVRANGGSVTIGAVRYYEGTDKTVKCERPTQTVDALLAATGGDLDTVAEHFSASPFKYGAVRATLGEEQFNKLFHTEPKQVVKEGKPVRAPKKLMTARAELPKPVAASSLRAAAMEVPNASR